MIRIGKHLYNWCMTGDLIICGEIRQGIDGEYIIWYA